MSNQSELLSNAQYAEKEAASKLRDAQRTLDATPRSENLAATRARDAAQSAFNTAAALTRQRQAEFDQANQRR